MSWSDLYLYDKITTFILGENAKIMGAIEDFVTKVSADFTSVSASLDNIAADEANLAKQIADLTLQLQNSGLTPAELQALSQVSSAADAMSTRTKSIADAVPDLPPPPPPPATGKVA